MSIVTKTGDKGTTGLMYGRRVSKCDPRVEACGAVDELNTALGFARATATDEFSRANLLLIQKDLIVLMGEVGVSPEDLPRYTKDGYSRVTPEMTAKLDALVHQLESENLSFKGWATPGENVNSAAFEMARTTCRCAERRVCALKDSGGLGNGEILIFLNRLADLLWLFARRAETQPSR